MLLATWRAVVEFIDDRGHRDAAQIGFFALLAFVPLALLVVGGFGVFLDDDDVRRRVVDTAFDYIPLAEEDDRPRLERTVDESLAGAGRLSVVSVLLLIASASAVMGALRHAINEAWDIDARPSLLRRKALDVALVLGGMLVLLLSLSLTATRRAAELLDDEGASGAFLGAVLEVVGDVLPFAFIAATILFLYRVLPMQRPRIREIWPGALVATLLLGLVTAALDLYFDHFADFGALYGSLGALMALLVFVFASANVLVFGAEFASEWSRLPGDDDEVRARLRTGRTRVRGLLSRVTPARSPDRR